MTHYRLNVRELIGAALHDLASDAEAVLIIAQALEDNATGIGRTTEPQKLLERAALVKSAALALVMAAANVVGVTDRLTVVASFAQADDSGGGDLPS